MQFLWLLVCIGMFYKYRKKLHVNLVLVSFGIYVILSIFDSRSSLIMKGGQADNEVRLWNSTYLPISKDGFNSKTQYWYKCDGTMMVFDKYSREWMTSEESRKLSEDYLKIDHYEQER